jgi:hypothetical protein
MAGKSKSAREVTSRRLATGEALDVYLRGGDIEVVIFPPDDDDGSTPDAECVLTLSPEESRTISEILAHAADHAEEDE